VSGRRRVRRRRDDAPESPGLQLDADLTAAVKRGGTSPGIAEVLQKARDRHRSTPLTSNPRRTP
jgi:hypothetical protein